jgi:hypothetical protein
MGDDYKSQDRGKSGGRRKSRKNIIPLCCQVPEQNSGKSRYCQAIIDSRLQNIICIRKSKFDGRKQPPSKKFRYRLPSQHVGMTQGSFAWHKRGVINYKWFSISSRDIDHPTQFTPFQVPITRDSGPETATGDNVISVTIVAKNLMNMFFLLPKQAVSPQAVDPQCPRIYEVITKVYFIHRTNRLAAACEVTGCISCPLFDWRKIGWSYQASR